MRLIERLAAWLAIPIAAWAARPKDFRAEMIARLAKAMPGVTLTPDPDDSLAILTKDADGEEGVINLHRIERFCAHARARDCEAAKADYVATSGLKPAKPTAASLRLIVRDHNYRDYVDDFSKKDPAKGDFAKYREIGEDLFAFLASDDTHAISTVGDTTLKELGLSADAAWALALAQTRAVLPPLPEPSRLAKSAMAYEDKEYLASLLIDLPAWEAIAAKVGPDLFVTAVSDQVVFVGTMPDGPGLDDLRKAVAEDCAAQLRCVSPHIYRFRGGRWVIAR
jgi:hypothetical protein